jgi:hypothetical protein
MHPRSLTRSTQVPMATLQVLQGCHFNNDLPVKYKREGVIYA